MPFKKTKSTIVRKAGGKTTQPLADKKMVQKRQMSIQTPKQKSRMKVTTPKQIITQPTMSVRHKFHMQNKTSTDAIMAKRIARATR